MKDNYLYNIRIKEMKESLIHNSKILPLNELVKGEIYYEESKWGNCLVKHDKYTETSERKDIWGTDHLYVNDSNFIIAKLSSFYYDLTGLRKATIEEKCWFNVCKKAGKFISKEKALNKINNENNMEKNSFAKGDHVVLLSCCRGHNSWKDTLPINYVYRLKEDFTIFNFSVEKDIKNNSNFWTNFKKTCLSKLEIRKANDLEINLYNFKNKPVNIKYIYSSNEEDNEFYPKYTNNNSNPSSLITNEKKLSLPLIKKTKRIIKKKLFKPIIKLNI